MATVQYQGALSIARDEGQSAGDTSGGACRELLPVPCKGATGAPQPEQCLDDLASSRSFTAVETDAFPSRDSH
jgi:hypothetical protein